MKLTLFLLLTPIFLTPINLIALKYFVLDMEFDNKEEYRIIFWKGNLDDDNMSLFLHSKTGEYDYLDYHR